MTAPDAPMAEVPTASGADLVIRARATGTTGYRPLGAPRRPRQLPATLLERAGALLMDAVVAFVVVPLPVSVATWLTGRPLVPCTWQADVQTCFTTEADLRFSRILFWSLATVFVLGHSWLISRRRTIGQYTTGVLVVDSATGKRIGVGRAVARTVGSIVSALPLGLGYWWAIWEPEGRTWHDLATRTRSIST